MRCQMFSIGERSGLQAGQFSTQTLLLRSYAVVIAAVCGFALSCWNTRRLEGSLCCSKTFIYLSAFIVPSKTCKYSWAHLVMSMTESYRCVMQCRLRARRPRESNKHLRPFPLRTEISPVSLYLSMMFCTVYDEICEAIWNLTLRNVVFKVF